MTDITADRLPAWKRKMERNESPKEFQNSNDNKKIKIKRRRQEQWKKNATAEVDGETQVRDGSRSKKSNELRQFIGKFNQKS